MATRPAHLQPATAAAYGRDWAQFRSWATAAQLDPLPVDDRLLLDHLQDLAGRAAPAVVRRRAAAIAHRHTAAGFPSPTGPGTPAAAFLAELPRAPAGGRWPLRRVDLLWLVDAAGRQLGPLAARDRALLLVGWAAGLRPGEVAGGLMLTIRRPGRETTEDLGGVAVTRRAPARPPVLIAVPAGRDPASCPARAWRAWAQTRA